MKKSLLTLLVAALAATAHAQTAPAFPGAEGFARYTTTGGRGGAVYHVTNLNDSGTGSLRWALSKSGSKTIVFDVSGYIDLESQLNISSNTTIAGQTAPGNGITLRYRTIYFGNADNVIVRFIRFRRSQVKDVDDGADAAWGRHRKNIILDHCSFSWSIDEVASFYDNQNFTMQWCFATEALANPGHSKGEHSYGGIWGGKGASFHHNMIAHVQNRAPRFNGARYNWEGYTDTDNLYDNSLQAERVDFRNCVMYNWGDGNGCYGGPGGGYINMVNNYYKAGPGTSNRTRVTQVSVANSDNSEDDCPYLGYASRYYINGNYVTAASSPANYDWSGVRFDNGLSTISGERYIPDADHLYGDGVTYVKNSSNVDCVKLKLDEPIEAGDVTTHDAETAYERVLAYGGASFYRDAVDERIVSEAASGTTTYTGSVSKTAGIIDVINDPSSSTQSSSTASFPTLASETRPAGYDSDNDGMPDEWEEAHGLNPNSAIDRNNYTIDSEKKWYTNLEVYLNSLVEDIVKAGNDGATTAVDEYYPATATTVKAARAKGDVEKIEYFDLEGNQLNAPAKGVSLRKTTFINGQTYTDKVVK